jgi:hypothetical protein
MNIQKALQLNGSPKRLFPAALFLCLTVSTVTDFAQDTQSEDDSSPPSMVDVYSPTAISTFPDGTSATVKSHAGKFPLVSGAARALVAVQFRVQTGVTSATAESLDGAVLSDGAGNISVASDGLASFQIQLGSKPGLYRVSLTGGNSSAVLQYWVVDPNNPDATPVVVQPQ